MVVETSNEDTRLFLFQSIVSSAVTQKSISILYGRDYYLFHEHIIFSSGNKSDQHHVQNYSVTYENEENENKQISKWRNQLEIHISYFNPVARKDRVESYSS